MQTPATHLVTIPSVTVGGSGYTHVIATVGGGANSLGTVFRLP